MKISWPTGARQSKSILATVIATEIHYQAETNLLKSRSTEQQELNLGLEARARGGLHALQLADLNDDHERLRNEEFERALKSANVDLVNAKQIQAEFDNMQQAYAEAMRRL